MPDMHLSMDDRGTRLQHLSDLQELWSEGLEILTRGSYHTPWEMDQAHDLEVALKLLEDHMMKDYNSFDYAREINKLPKNPEEIR